MASSPFTIGTVEKLLNRREQGPVARQCFLVEFL